MTPTRQLWLTLAAACLAGAFGCERPEEPSAPLAPAPAPSAKAVAPSVMTAALDPETLPAEEDFEEEVQATITSSNLDKQLELLEKEILGN